MDPIVWISDEIPSCTYYCAPPTGFNAIKPTELISVDTRLWQQFSSEIDQHVSQLNVGLRWAFISLYFFTVPLFVFIIMMSLPLPMFRDTLLEYSKYSSFLFIIPLIVFYVGYFKIITKNQKVDAAIKIVCETFKAQFESKGFSIEYRTKWTGICKPKHARPTRAIAFPRVLGFEESQTNDLGTGIGNPTKDANFNNQFTGNTSVGISNQTVSNGATSFQYNTSAGISNQRTNTGAVDGGFDLIDRKKWGLE